jgi:hypothetical protein
MRQNAVRRFDHPGEAEASTPTVPSGLATALVGAIMLELV